MKRKKTHKQNSQAVPVESLKARCARLRTEAEAGNDDASAMFFTALFQAMTLRIPEELKEANLILLLDRKLAD